MNTRPISLVISDISIRQDAEGRYCLNDLHRASGGNQKDKPYEWLRLEQTKSLISALRENPASEKINDIEPVKTVNSFKDEQGTFVCKELVYAYATWISPAFFLKVIRIFDAVVTGAHAVPALPNGLRFLDERITIPKFEYDQLKGQEWRIQDIERRQADAHREICNHIDALARSFKDANTALHDHNRSLQAQLSQAKLKAQRLETENAQLQTEAELARKGSEQLPALLAENKALTQEVLDLSRELLAVYRALRNGGAV